MNVQPTPDPRSSTPVTHAGAVQADDARRAAAPAPASSRPEASGDRVEISAQGRADAGRLRADSPEIETARIALRAGEDLGAARLHELRERVRTGHYDQPEAVARLAEAAVRDLGR